MLLCCRPSVLSCPAAFLGVIVVVILVIVYGTRSDYAELNPVIGELLPAGHCLCHTSANFECATCLDRVEAFTSTNASWDSKDTWVYNYERDGSNEALSTEQCNAAFPGYFEDIDRAAKLRRKNPVKKADLDSMKMYKGMVRAMIYDGELYVIQIVCKGEDHRKKVVATLASIYRAMTATPWRRDLPNVEFIFTIEDMADDPDHPLWVLTRRIEDHQLWLMPDFGFWSWNVDGIGPYTQVVSEISTREVDRKWDKKEEKLVWRGKLSFAPKLRRALLDAAHDKSWSAVRALQWFSEDSMMNDFMSSVDQCNYLFIAHTEGRSYSASLKYRQACRSVIIIHKLQWIQNHHYLLIANGPHQNFVEVERDFSDLGDKMESLLAHPAEARRIADNNVKTFRERYLTPAAQACYWRALMQGWAKVSFTPELYEKHGQHKRLRGLRFESFLVLESSEQLNFRASETKLLGG